VIKLGIFHAALLRDESRNWSRVTSFIIGFYGYISWEDICTSARVKPK